MLPDPDPIARDLGLVLRWFPVTDTSRIVIWFTLQHGKISTLLKGCQRPKSWMLGQYDLFYTCEVLFYTRAREDLHILRECAPLRSRPAFRSDWKACAAASFVVDLLYRVPPPGAAAPELYHLAEHTLDHLAAAAPSPALLFWYELQLYRRLGLEPRVSPPNGAQALFDYRGGHVGPGTSHSETAPITPGAHAILGNLLAADRLDAALRLRLSSPQTREIAGHLDRFSQWHLDQLVDSRHRALEWVR